MARQRSLSLATFNLEINAPHEALRYQDLWFDLFALRKPIKSRGDLHLVISSANPSRSLPHVITGTIARYTKIDPTMPWFDEQSLDKAQDEDLEHISIPRHLNPNYRTAYYAFDTESHRLYVETYGYDILISPRNILNLLSGLLAEQAIVVRYDKVGFSIIQTVEALEEIESLHFIKTFTIEYNQPNSDDHDRFDKIFAEKMRAANARNATLNLEAGISNGIVLDAELRHLAQSALEHGRLLANGKDSQGRFVRLSSEDHPDIQTERYDPNLTTHLQAFGRLVRRLVDGKGS